MALATVSKAARYLRECSVPVPPQVFVVLVQFPCEIDRPSEVYLSRFTPNSAMLRPLKVEAGINGLLPTSWVPSIYSVSRLSRLRSALGRLLHFAFDSPALVPRSGLSTAKAVGNLFGWQTGGGFAFW